MGKIGVTGTRLFSNRIYLYVTKSSGETRGISVARMKTRRIITFGLLVTSGVIFGSSAEHTACAINSYAKYQYPISASTTL